MINAAMRSIGQCSMYEASTLSQHGQPDSASGVYTNRQPSGVCGKVVDVQVSSGEVDAIESLVLRQRQMTSAKLSHIEARCSGDGAKLGE